MRLLAFLLVLAALTAVGFSIQCKYCWHFGTQACTSPVVECASGEVCVAAVTEITILGTLQAPEYAIACGPVSTCNLTGSLTFDNGNIRTGTSCCNTNNCTPATPQVPKLSMVKNGLTCNTCSTDNSDYCYDKDKIACTGEERKCGRMARKLTGTITKKNAIRGCVSKTFCETLGNQKTTISGLNVDMKMFCSDDAANLYGGFLYSLLAALLAKLLL